MAEHESWHASSPCKSEQQTSHNIQNCEPEAGCQVHGTNSQENECEERRSRPALAVLVVGHYCHDRIKLVGGKIMNVLGGSASYISKVLDALSVNSCVVSKVGPDFRFLSQVSHPPLIVEGQHTTQFYADYTAGEDRILRVGEVCEPILSADIPASQGEFSLGLAVGVAGEITVSAIERILDVSEHVIVDLQALIRRIDPTTGDVSLQHIRNTPFHSILHRISFLKATRAEAAYIDLDRVRQITCVLVTDGKHGSTVYHGDKEHHVQPFATEEVDPTGAGDCFLAGFVVGLYNGLAVEKAARLGNYFGALAVAQIGIPELQQDHVQELQGIFYGIEEDEMNCNPQTADRYHTTRSNQTRLHLKN